MVAIKEQKVASKEFENRLVQKVRCPNCGSVCERHFMLETQLTRTECSSCDYLMVTKPNGGVVEAYAPGIYAYS